jgi:hypothetical protein
VQQQLSVESAKHHHGARQKSGQKIHCQQQKSHRPMGGNGNEQKYRKKEENHHKITHITDGSHSQVTGK